MDKLEEAESKLKFADYLMQRDNFPEYAPAVAKHILAAANAAVSINFSLAGTNISHILINKKLAEGSKEEREFSGTYLSLWKLAVNPQPAKEEVTMAMARVKTFVGYVKGRRAI